MTEDTAELLSEREKTHGNFSRVAQRALATRNALFAAQLPGKNIAMAQVEAINQICTKLARIVEGDAAFEDHWDDVEGYAALGKQHRIAPAPTMVEVTEDDEDDSDLED